MSKRFYIKIFILYVLVIIIAVAFNELFIVQHFYKKDLNIFLRLKLHLPVIITVIFLGLLHLWQAYKTARYVNLVDEFAGALAHGIFRKKLYIDEAGKFTELAKNLNHMATELKDNVEKLQEETSRLNVILKSIPNAILHIDARGIIKLANREALNLFGVSQLYGRPFIEIIRSPDFLSLVEQVKENRMPAAAEITLDFPRECYLSVRLSPLAYKVGDISGFIAIFNDITRIKKLEQMRRDFVANISHEIKTPITAISGFAETLIDGAMEDRVNAEKFLSTIKDHSDRVNRLVDDLLTLSEIELGRDKINKSEFNLSEVIEDVSRTMIIKAAEKDIRIKKSINENIRITADRDKTEQILLNLVDNAIKFTDHGEVEIGCSREDDKTFFYVKDTGIGIPEDYIPRLGERFFRVDPSRSRDLGGTGLGLAIVKHIAKIHGWDMEISSVVKQGTIVKILLSRLS